MADIRQLAIAVALVGCGATGARPPAPPADTTPPGFVCPPGTQHKRIDPQRSRAWVCGRSVLVSSDEIHVCADPGDPRGVQTGPLLRLRADRVHTEGSCVRDVHDGRWATYYPDGKLHTEGFFVMGRAQGRYRSFYPSGRLHREVERHDHQVVWSREYEDEDAQGVEPPSDDVE